VRGYCRRLRIPYSLASIFDRVHLLIIVSSNLWKSITGVDWSLTKIIETWISIVQCRQGHRQQNFNQCASVLGRNLHLDSSRSVSVVLLDWHLVVPVRWSILLPQVRLMDLQWFPAETGPHPGQLWPNQLRLQRRMATRW